MMTKRISANQLPDATFRSEADFQKWAAKFMRDHFPFPQYVWWHTANERHTSQRRGYDLKLSGVLPGVPDLICLNWQACFELKYDKNRLTVAQKDFRNAVTLLDWKFHECRTTAQFRAAVLEASGATPADLERNRKKTLNARIQHPCTGCR